jgi:hypothetical protein
LTEQPPFAWPPEPEPERRECACFRPGRGSEIRYVVRRSFRTGWAVLEDVSAAGARLLLDHDPGPMAVLLLQLPGRRAGQTNTRLARVLDAEPGPDDRWCVECRFSPPLSDAELGLIRQ